MKPARLYLIFFGIIGAYAGLAMRLYDLQIAHGEFYSARAAAQYRVSGFLEPHRGVITITDKNGARIHAADNKQGRVIVAIPREIKDIEAAVENISPIVNIEAEKLRGMLSGNKAYKLLVKNPTDEQVREVLSAGIKGIKVDEHDERVYPFGSLLSHVVGFTGPTSEDDRIEGRYGIEKRAETALRGVPGSLEGGEVLEAVQGTDVHTTIDHAIQSKAENIIRKLVKEKRAAGGTVIVQDPGTGTILAMASTPDFDPNNYKDYPVSSFLNPAVQARYEPGSVFKIITAAIGLDRNAFTPETTFYDSGVLQFKDGKRIKNWDLKAHGTVTMTNIIEESLNTGAAFMQRAIGNKPFYEGLKAFGFTAPTGIELPGEISGNLKNIESHTADIDFAAASFGQGVAVTPIQLVTAVSAIANGGTLMKPRITETTKPEAVRRVISPEAARQATNMMISAVRKANVAHIPNFTVAGKTGTAQAVDLVRGGYAKDVINTYTGFAPASKPRFVILIKLDKPAGAPLAGTTVVPAFKELAEFIITYYNIPPDNLTEPESA